MTVTVKKPRRRPTKLYHAPILIGVYLRLLRTYKGMTQEQVANSIPGLTKTLVSQCESGAAEIGDDALEYYASAWGLDLDFLRKLRSDDYADYLGHNEVLRRARAECQRIRDEAQTKGWDAIPAKPARKWLPSGRQAEPQLMLPTETFERMQRRVIPRKDEPKASMPGIATLDQCFDFAERIAEIAPRPAEGPLRAEWRAHVSALFKMSVHPNSADVTSS